MRFHPMTGRNLKSGSLYELNFQGSQFRGTLEEPSTGLQRLPSVAGRRQVHGRVNKAVIDLLTHWAPVQLEITRYRGSRSLLG
jgi:hypothetical protein